MKIEGHIKNKMLRCQMLALALTEANLAHVFVRYSGHVNEFQVEAIRADAIYSPEGRKPSDRLFRYECYVDRQDEANEALNKMIDALEDIQIGAIA